MKKFFILFYLNIKDMWKNHKFIFTVINLFIFFSFLFMIIALSSLNYSVFNSDIDVYKSYAFEFEIKNDKVTEDKIDIFLKNHQDIKNVYFSFNNEGDSFPENNIEYYFSKEMFFEKVYALYSGNFTQNVQTYEGRWFTDEEINTGAKVVVVPNRKGFSNSGVPLPDYNIGDTFCIKGEDYTIIGKNNFIMDYVFIVPYKSIEDKSVFLRLNFVLGEKYAVFEAKKTAKSIEEYFGVSLKKLPDTKNIVVEVAIYVIYFLLFNLSIINIVYIYEFLFKGRIDTLYNLFQKYKVKKNQYIHYAILECLVIAIINMVLSVIFANLFFVTLKSDFNFDYLSLLEYLIVFAGFILIYYCAMFPVIARLTGNMNDTKEDE